MSTPLSLEEYKKLVKTQKKPRKREETDTLRAIIIYLKAKRWLPIRINTGGVWLKDRGIHIPSPNITPGVADILAIKIGQRPLAVEAKSKTGEQSEKQKAFERAWLLQGGFYLLARSVQDVIDAGI